jgi:FtsP/CotA-like multicopper oxidase with cupredoxin domain
VHREVALTLDDLLVGDEGLLPHGGEAPTHALMGRFGNVFLTNGSPDWRLRVARGEVVRFLLTNVANARIFNVSFGGLPMKLIGSDLGAFEREEWIESVAIAPAERYTVEVRFPASGSVALRNRIQSVDHMLGTYTARTDTLGIVDVGSAAAAPDLAVAFDALRARPDVAAEIDRYRPHFDRPPDREIHLAMDVSGLSPALVQSMLIGFPPAIDWNDGMPMLNWLLTGRDVRWTFVDPATGDENMAIRWRFRTGDIVKLRILNRADAFHAMSHPIHVHGQRFLVVSRNGEPVENRVWKDTVIVPVGEAVDVLLDITNPGSWMLHCHVAEHLGTGMMSVFEVQPSTPGQ